MILAKIEPKRAVNPAYLKIKPTRAEIDAFKARLIEMLDACVHAESEEFHKNLVANFLRLTYYQPRHFINTKGRADLVVHHGEGPQSQVAVIVEAKRPANSAQMVRVDNVNTKAFQELLLYYLRERFRDGVPNHELRHLIVTNAHEWFIFDAAFFEKEFARNTLLLARFRDFEAGRLAGKTTDFFYREIAAPAIAAVQSEVRFAYFNLRDYEAALRNTDLADDAQLVALYKLLSPQHLLKQPFQNDSNTLHLGFYTELLHIIGLAEVRDRKGRLISRLAPADRQPASLLENAIRQLDALDKLPRVSNIARFGSTRDERLFNVALELVLTWINRVLFLKLLEAQLIGYHKGEKCLAFLGSLQVPTFDRLDSLFFQVLARQRHERSEDLSAFAHVPYLNSSLFEISELEHETITIGNLKDDLTLPVLPSTVLREADGRRTTLAPRTLDYLLRFLDAYDFGSEGPGAIQEENKSLINASVLGLIFEKINGYRDGSFFTPGYVTMRMCRDTVREAILRKFNDVKGWECADLIQLQDKITDAEEANEIFNSVRICDPAVGSGHFLVSALNELLALKAELGLLCDRTGRRLKWYTVTVANDELVMNDEDGELFRYHPASADSQRIQEALFHEKQVLIENCLFGLDINPNSVNICRLRLWIELLKSAYYRADNELETLPNIDINIKCGNALVSRFGLDVDVSKVLKAKGLRLGEYRNAVRSYHNARSKDEKRNMHALIERIKGELRTEIFDNDPKVRRLRAAQGELDTLRNQQVLFEESKAEKKVRIAAIDKLRTEVSRLEAQIAEVRNNRVFVNAFEWRLEFPEVLGDDGTYLGFDIVIGNPPYGVSVQGLDRDYLTKTLGKVPDFEIFYWFINRGRQILRPGGLLSLIVPNGLLFNVYAAPYRLKLLEDWSVLEVLDCSAFAIFPDATVRNCVILLGKEVPSGRVGFRRTRDATSFDELVAGPREWAPEATLREWNRNWALPFRLDPPVLSMISTLRRHPTLEEHFSVSQGYIPYRLSDLVKLYGEAKGKAIKEEQQWHADHPVDASYIEELKGRSLHRYGHERTGRYVKYGPHVASYVHPKFFNQRRLLVREITTPRITAALVDMTFVNDPQIISVIPKTGAVSLETLWAIVNSKLATFFHFNASPKAAKGEFPKILVQDLRGFPLPRQLGAALQPLERAARQAIAAKAADPQRDMTRDEASIDALVYQAYGLDCAQIQVIEDAF